jgi:hypothetical protein
LNRRLSNDNSLTDRTIDRTHWVSRFYAAFGTWSRPRSTVLIEYTRAWAGSSSVDAEWIAILHGPPRATNNP